MLLAEHQADNIKIWRSSLPCGLIDLFFDSVFKRNPLRKKQKYTFAR